MTNRTNKTELLIDYKYGINTSKWSVSINGHVNATVFWETMDDFSEGWKKIKNQIVDLFAQKIEDKVPFTRNNEGLLIESTLADFDYLSIIHSETTYNFKASILFDGIPE